MTGNGNGHVRAVIEVPRFYRDTSIEGVATAFGYKVDARVVVRFPARCRAELEAWILREQKTGRLCVDYTQGHEAVITWEETR